MNYKSIIIAIALLGTGLNAGAQGNGKPAKARPLVTTKIGLLTRAYGDSVVLRWSAEDYVSWKYLAEVGVNVLRVPSSASGTITAGSPDFRIDTLAYALKPLTFEQFQARFPESDTLALIPQGVLYGEAENRKNAPKGSMARSLEYNSEQDVSFGFAMMVAEWRPDLAEAMAVRFTDRTAQPGMAYDYYVQPTIWENGGRLIFEPGVAEGVVNRRYTPEPFDVVITDSLTDPHTILLRWHDARHSSYEIERRYVRDMQGTRFDNAAWEHATEKPYASMVQQADDEDLCLFVDSVDKVGVWEYRLLAYDAFADLTSPTPAHRAIVRDILPPTAPVLKYIALERPEQNPMSRVIANVIWQKNYIEDDLAGYRVYYNASQPEGSDNWRQLNRDLVAPADTLLRVDVTGLSTGWVYVAAIDHSGNEARSMVQQIRLDDYEAPPAPKGLKAEVEKNGRVTLTWNEPADDVDYYQVAFANDTTHRWNIRNQGDLKVPRYVDTLAMDINQKYIYYKVRAVDFSTNESEWSKVLQVKRPTFLVPAVAHLDSAWVDDSGIHMEWVVGADEQMNRHYVYRWQDGDKQRTVIARCNADSVKAAGYIIRIDDAPPYDKKKRYQYAVESFNTSHISSGLSLIYSAKRRPPITIDCKIDLVGDYIKKGEKTRLVWTPSALKADDSPAYYYCIYRKGPGEDLFHNVTTTGQTVTEYEDVLLRPGEQAQFYVKLRTKDGRESQPSNIITVTAPEKK